jgi:hypothetical protein
MDLDLDLVALKVRANFATWKLHVVILMNYCRVFFHNGVLYIILVMHACVYVL